MNCNCNFENSIHCNGPGDLCCDHYWVARTPFVGPVTRMFCTKCKLHRMKDKFE